MALEENVKNELKKFLAKLGVEVLSQIEKSGDPVSFGYEYDMHRYIIFLYVEVNEDRKLINVRLELQEQSRKWLVLKSLQLVSLVEFQIKPEMTKKQMMNLRDRIDNSLRLTSNDFQERIMLSKEPLTFSYVENEVNRQVEAVPVQGNQKKVDWLVFID